MSKEKTAVLDLTGKFTKDVLAENSRLRELKRLAARLVNEVIIGYENEHQEGWAENAKFHQCDACYHSAKKLRAELEKL